MSKAPRLKPTDVITTFRVLLATCIQQHGQNGQLVLTRAQMEAAGEGSLQVTDRPDGSIVLTIKKASGMMRPH